jgi:quinol monooxygenase YgiN
MEQSKTEPAPDLLIVTGAVLARPDTREALLAEAVGHVHRSRREDGCMSHEVCVSADDPLRFVFTERWRDLAALKVHFAQPGSARFMAAVRALGGGGDALAIYEARKVSRAG